MVDKLPLESLKAFKTSQWKKFYNIFGYFQIGFIPFLFLTFVMKTAYTEKHNFTYEIYLLYLMIIVSICFWLYQTCVEEAISRERVNEIEIALEVINKKVLEVKRLKLRKGGRYCSFLVLERLY